MRSSTHHISALLLLNLLAVACERPVEGRLDGSVEEAAEESVDTDGGLEQSEQPQPFPYGVFFRSSQTTEQRRLLHESLQAFRERLGVFFTGEVYALGDDGEHVLVFTYSGGERDREVGLQILDPGSPGPFWTGLIHTETDASFALLDVTDVSGDGEMDIVFCRSDDAGARLEVAVREGESWRWTTGDPASGCAY